MRIPLFILASLFALVVFAQDSTESRRIFISETQSSLSPALVSQFGKHVIRTDITLLPSYQSIENSNPVTQMQFAYQTQLDKHHGIGLYHIRNNSNLLFQSQAGVQYGFKARLAKQGIFKNTQMGIGLGLCMGKVYTKNDNLVFYDQFDSSSTIVRPSGEPEPNVTVYYPIFHSAFNLIGNKAYLLSSVNYMNRPKNGIHASEDSRITIEFNNQFGLHILSYHKFSLWGVLGFNINYKQYTSAFMGGTIMYNKRLAYHFKYRNLDGMTLAIDQQLSYTTNRVRVYAQYILPTGNSDFVQLSSFRLGLALSIVKK